MNGPIVEYSTEALRAMTTTDLHRLYAQTARLLDEITIEAGRRAEQVAQLREAILKHNDPPRSVA